ncbi:YqaE/Pmp3 family membrane protein [Desulfosporosinus sp. PR]|uniref:YqaE/Pmp3 family membrane protein n=1 Tax=Candidatus Desulfosporosinus nitrosoreducens TaxID=3401928 RepID=UPI0027F7A442|nr:YqaE/Pmp3 family membrane protein [Desulfosporosinus sp. PR]MDQ7094219.1 YqaE/Pmp3 family membrane protein [Desulfosporosinus sp. PR]
MQGAIKMYFLAIICPPLAVLLCGKPIQAILNLVLSLLFYFPGLIHALMVVSEKKSNERMQIQTQAIIRSSTSND